MLKDILIGFFLFFYANSVAAQELRVRSIMYDALDKPYKIEEQYLNREDSSFLYVSHFADGSNCFVVKRSMKSDTLMISEEFFEIEAEKKDEEVIPDYSGVTISSGNDSVHLKFFDSFSSATRHEKVLDTTIAQAEWEQTNADEFMKTLKNKRIAMILAGKKKVDLYDLLSTEIQRSYYAKGRLLKIEWFSPKEKSNPFKTCRCKNQLTSITCRSKYTGYGLNTSFVDSIAWNTDTSKINWSVTYSDKKRYTYQYLIAGNKVKVYSNDTLDKEIEYLDRNDYRDFGYTLKGRLDKDIISTNYLFIDTRYSTVRRIVYADGNIYAPQYLFDKEGRVVEVKYFRKGKLSERVTYEYF